MIKGLKDWASGSWTDLIYYILSNLYIKHSSFWIRQNKLLGDMANYSGVPQRLMTMREWHKKWSKLIT